MLWSPLVDRFGERRRWIAGCVAVMAGCLLVFARGAEAGGVGRSPGSRSAVFCLASATQDIAIDAYTIGLVERGREGPANSVRITAYRVGLIAARRHAAAAALDRLAGRLPGRGARAAALFAIAVLACPPVAVPEVGAPRAAPGRCAAGSLRSGVLSVAAFVLLYRVGDRAMGPMVTPFWVDRGFTNEEIAFAQDDARHARDGRGRGGRRRRGGAHRASAARSRCSARSRSPRTSATPRRPRTDAGGSAWSAASALESFCGGLASAAFLSYLMRICEKEHAAVQYALLTSLYALAGTLVAAPSGWITERIGYAAYFALTAAFALPAFAFLPRRAQLARASGPAPAAALTPASPREPRPDPPRS